MELGGVSIRNLAEMLKPDGDEDDSSDDDLPPCSTAKLGPGSIGPAKGSGGERVTGCGAVAAEGGAGDGAGADVDAIWSAAEVQQSACEDEDPAADPRPTPDYDMCFRQAVTPEDVFLQLGGRTPGTASCEELVVRVRLPGERLADVSLSVTSTRVDVRSPTWRLGLPLPHAVDPQRSRAGWDAAAHTLTLTLRLVREFDYVNF